MRDRELRYVTISLLCYLQLGATYGAQLTSLGGKVINHLDAGLGLKRRTAMVEAPTREILMDDAAWTIADRTTYPSDDALEVEFTSPAIARLIEEVRVEESGVPRSYNRTFNRHNR